MMIFSKLWKIFDGEFVVIYLHVDTIEHVNKKVYLYNNSTYLDDKLG